VVGDLRAPDRLRLGPAPITSRFTDVWDAADIIRRVAGGEEATRSRGAHGQPASTGARPGAGDPVAQRDEILADGPP
jgi:hypothetical protein